MKKLILYFSIACSIASCHSGSGKTISKIDNNGDPVSLVKSEDEEINKAIDSAKKTYDAFLKAFPVIEQDSSKSDFSVKMRFVTEDGGGEHMWLNELHMKNNKLFGVMRGNPVYHISAKTGDTLAIDPNLVSDWMYIDKGRLMGGYTIKAFYDRMSSKEKEELEQQMGAKIR